MCRKRGPTKSVRTQFDPINVVNPELLQNQNSRGDILKVKIKLPQGRTKAVNTDLSFPMQAHVQFFVSFDEDDNDSTGDDDDVLCDDVPASSRETEHKDPLYEPENQYSSTSDVVIAAKAEIKSASRHSLFLLSIKSLSILSML